MYQDYTIVLNELDNEKQKLKKRFRNQKTGEQLYSESASKLFNPITKELEKDTHALQSLMQSQSNQYLNEQRNLNNKLDANIQNMDRYIKLYEDSYTDRSIEESPKERVAKAESKVYFDPNEGLVETDVENLKHLNLPLPSKIVGESFNKRTIEEIKAKISSNRRSLGQYLREDNKEKHTPEKTEEFESLKETLVKYKKAIEALEAGLDYKKGEGIIKSKKLVREKRKRGRPKKNVDPIYYDNFDDLVEKLHLNIAAKSAGNTGLDNHIIAILDELLHKKVLLKSEYDTLFKNIFPNYL